MSTYYVANMGDDSNVGSSMLREAIGGRKSLHLYADTGVSQTLYRGDYNLVRAKYAMKANILKFPARDWELTRLGATATKEADFFRTQDSHNQLPSETRSSSRVIWDHNQNSHFTNRRDQTWRATGITIYLENDGRLEHGLQVAGHEATAFLRRLSRRTISLNRVAERLVTAAGFLIVSSRLNRSTY
jgi:hypothetical protein